MAILDINEKFDPLFEKKWTINNMSWGGYGERGAKEISKRWLEHMVPNGDLWDRLLDIVTTAHWIHYKAIPEWVRTMRDELNSLIVKMVRRYNPEFRYITIKYDTLIQGNDKIEPCVTIRADSEWFGYDRRSQYGYERHASFRADICHHHTWPIPTKSGIIPESKRWPKANWIDSRYWAGNDANYHFDNAYTFFPEDDPYYRG